MRDPPNLSFPSDPIHVNPMTCSHLTLRMGPLNIDDVRLIFVGIVAVFISEVLVDQSCDLSQRWTFHATILTVKKERTTSQSHED